jgi:hypothetical protein
MMTSFYNLLKYAQTGIASPDMTYYDKMRASTLMGGAVQTLTGQPPLSFKSNGTPLISWSMKGNGSQQGTPTPDNPIMPEFVGVRTGNLWDEDYIGIIGDLKYVPVFVGDGPFTLSTDTPIYSGNAPLFLLSGNVTSGASTSKNGVYNGVSRTTNSSNGYITIAFRRQSEESNPVTHKTMLNLGSTALPYEPFGYKIPITCAGQTVPVYLGQTQTVRRVRKQVLTGTEDWEKGNYPKTNSYQFYIPRIKYFPDAKSSIPSNNSFCTHFINQETAGGIAWGTNFNVYMLISDLPEDATANDFKVYLAAQYSAGTPVTVWYPLETEQTGIINEPLAKIGDYADELHSTDAAVTITTAKGNNVLTIDSDLQPSEMSITYRG